MIQMNSKLAIATLLMGLMATSSLLNPAFAVRYTQILPNNNAPVNNTLPVHPVSPTSAPSEPSYYNVGYNPGRVYQGQLRQNVTLPTLHAETSSRQPLQGPQAILDNIKAKNNVPATVAPTISVENSKVLNSYTDGQKIVITSNLLNKLTTNDQRAFVISHELSHVLLSHVAKTQVRRVGLSLFDTFIVRHYVGQGTPLDLATRFGIGLVDMRSSRGFEYQADDLGVRLMSGAGYDPEAAIQVFDILKANTPSSQTPGFLMDHPITDDRIRTLAQKYKLKQE